MRKTAAMVSRVLAGAGEGYRDFSQQLQCTIMYYATYFISWTVISLFFFYTNKRNYDNDFHHHPENIDHQSTPPKPARKKPHISSENQDVCFSYLPYCVLDYDSYGAFCFEKSVKRKVVQNKSRKQFNARQEKITHYNDSAISIFTGYSFDAAYKSILGIVVLLYYTVACFIFISTKEEEVRKDVEQKVYKKSFQDKMKDIKYFVRLMEKLEEETIYGRILAARYERLSSVMEAVKDENDELKRKMHVLETDLKAEKELSKMLEAINTQSELRLQSCEEEKDGKLTRQLNTTNLSTIETREPEAAAQLADVTINSIGTDWEERGGELGEASVTGELVDGNTDSRESNEETTSANTRKETICLELAKVQEEAEHAKSINRELSAAMERLQLQYESVKCEMNKAQFSKQELKEDLERAGATITKLKEEVTKYKKVVEGLDHEAEGASVNWVVAKLEPRATVEGDESKMEVSMVVLEANKTRTSREQLQETFSEVLDTAKKKEENSMPGRMTNLKQRLGNVVKTVSSFLSGSFHSSSSSAGQPTPDGRTPDGHIPSCSYTIMHTNKELQSYSSDGDINSLFIPKGGLLSNNEPSLSNSVPRTSCFTGSDLPPIFIIEENPLLNHPPRNLSTYSKYPEEERSSN